MKIEGIRKLIKEERVKQGMGVGELVRKAGVTRRSVQYWESGKRGMSLKNAVKVLNTLGMKILIVKKGD